MLPNRSGSFPLFTFSGIQVYVHWSWFIVAWLEISTRSRAYSSWVWNVVEYLGLFLIVLLHEFGHLLACRQTGGVADQIVLWPLGGVALGRPPPRPGAELWTIAAGPLVNVVLWPVLMVATWVCGVSPVGQHFPDFERLLFMLWYINRGLLIFNLLPIYPLDGGQILRSLLWFKLGRARSLQVAAVIGLAGLVGGAGFLLWNGSGDVLWTGLLVLFLGSRCLAAFGQARALRVLESLPRHEGFACPTCHAKAPAAPVWRCEGCGNTFDAFLNQSVCPHCQRPLPAIGCVECGASHPIEQWKTHVRTEPRSNSPFVDI